MIVPLVWERWGWGMGGECGVVEGGCIFIESHERPKLD